MRDPSQWPVWSDPQEYNRRSVYLYVKRAFRMPMLESFDQPETSLSCDRRDATTVAPQALALMNGEFSLKEAKAFAASLVKDNGTDSTASVREAWRRALGRLPDPAEQRKALDFLGSHSAGMTELCLMLFNVNEFLYVD